ncbi:Transposase [Shigella dysenteriae 1617]|uniref:Transposase n=1 Tax=Shigella dysenteriae 1617 TaxID=754093 RepID=A0A0A7A3I4_SHIDY|nr:Transposase [Shigella dysenteriae 1617]
MAFNGAGVRDTARTLKIGINTVIRTLKNSPPKRIKRLRPLSTNWKHHQISANLMSNGVSLAVKPGNTGSGTRWPGGAEG